MELLWILVSLSIFSLSNCKKCKDSLSRKSSFTIQGTNGKTEKLKSCNRLLECYPHMCTSMGGKQGKCCKTCSQIEDLQCYDQLTKCHTLPVAVDGVKMQIDSCNELVTKYPEFCDSKYKYFGGEKKACCKSCKEVEQKLVKCQPKDVEANCFCYPEDQCDGANIIPCPRASKNSCKKLGKNYACCCQKVFWTPFCGYDPTKGKINHGSTQNFNSETGDLPPDLEAFFNDK